MSDKTTEVQTAEVVEELDEQEVTESEALVLKSYSPNHLDIQPHRLASRVYSYGKGEYRVTDIDAKGIKTIALRLGISITSSKFKETSDGKGYYFTAKARNLVTGQKATDHCFQTKTLPYNKGNLKKGDFDEDALAKGATRVVRRVRRQLIPEEIVDQTIEYAMIGENTPDAVGTAKKDAETARERSRQVIKSMGITTTQCYEDAVRHMGPAENWGAAEWYALRDKYLDPENEFAHLVNKEKPKAKPTPQPQLTDLQRAYQDVANAVEKLKTEKPDLVPYVLTEDGMIRRDLLNYWFQTETKSLDVAGCGTVVLNINGIINSNYNLLLPNHRPAEPAQPETPSTQVQPDEVPPQTEPEPEPPPPTAQDLNRVINELGNTDRFKAAGLNPNSLTELVLQLAEKTSLGEIDQRDIAYLIEQLQAEDAVARFEALKGKSMPF